MEDVNIFNLYVIFIGGIIGLVISLLAYLSQNYKLSYDILTSTSGFVIGLGIIFLIFNGLAKSVDYVNYRNSINKRKQGGEKQWQKKSYQNI